jgi:hypothetical protein
VVDTSATVVMCSVAASSSVVAGKPGLSMVGDDMFREKCMWKVRLIHATQLVLDYRSRKPVKKPKYTKIRVEQMKRTGRRDMREIWGKR